LSSFPISFHQTPVAPAGVPHDVYAPISAVWAVGLSTLRGGVKGPHPCSRLAVPVRWSMVLTGWSAAAELPGCRRGVEGVGAAVDGRWLGRWSMVASGVRRCCNFKKFKFDPRGECGPAYRETRGRLAWTPAMVAGSMVAGRHPPNAGWLPVSDGPMPSIPTSRACGHVVFVNHAVSVLDWMSPGRSASFVCSSLAQRLSCSLTHPNNRVMRRNAAAGQGR
jgi:hypothetical protein